MMMVIVGGGGGGGGWLDGGDDGQTIDSLRPGLVSATAQTLTCQLIRGNVFPCHLLPISPNLCVCVCVCPYH